MKEEAAGGEGKQPREVLFEITTGYMLSQCLYVAAKLGIADMLVKGARDCEDLAEDCGADSHSLYRIMRTLSSFSVFFEEPDGRFSLNPTGELLRSDVPESLRGWTIMRGEEFLWQPWGSVLHSVKTGAPAFNHVFGMPAFEYLGEQEDAAAVFDDAMRSVSAEKYEAVADSYDFSGIDTIVDIGGGNGGLLTAILGNNRQMNGILGELPHVLESAREHLAAAGLADRCDCVEIDMFEGVPPGGDAYILGNVIHDWDDERCVTILSNCRNSMPDSGRVLLVEMVLSPANAPHLSKLADIEMLIMTEGGCERTEEEYGALYEASGFRLSRVVPTESPWSVIEGLPA